MPPSPFSLLPLLYKAKIILLEIIQFLLYLLSKSIRNVSKASGEAKMQTFPLVLTMVGGAHHKQLR